MRFMNTHHRARPISVLRHEPAFCALFGSRRRVLTPCASHFAAALPTQPELVSSRSTAVLLSLRSLSFFSYRNSIQIP